MAVARNNDAPEALNPYERPAIEARDAIDQVAISELISSGTPKSAVFRHVDRRTGR